MKNIPVFYTFQNKPDPIPNLFAIANVFPNLDEFKIKHVLQQFPFPIDSKPYHIRFKTYCEETEPKILAWIDISNYNAKVPLVNNAVYIKILELPNDGLSKIYTNQKLQTVLKTKQNNEQTNSQRFHSQQNQIEKQKAQSPVNTAFEQQYPWQYTSSSQNNLIQQASNQVSSQRWPMQNSAKELWDLEQQPKQTYYQQQKILDNLLTDGHDIYSQNSQDENNFPANQQFGDFQMASLQQPQQLQQQQQQQQQKGKQSQNNSNNDLNLLDDEMNAPIERQQMKEARLKEIQQRVQDKADNLKEIWDNEEKYTQWRQNAKEQLETTIKGKAWALKDNVRNNIRILLASLHEILWAEADWQKYSLSDLLTDGKVKQIYVKAIRLVHPDKHQSSDYRQRYIAERVFYELNQAWNAYKVRKIISIILLRKMLRIDDLEYVDWGRLQKVKQYLNRFVRRNRNVQFCFVDNIQIQ